MEIRSALHTCGQIVLFTHTSGPNPKFADWSTFTESGTIRNITSCPRCNEEIGTNYHFIQFPSGLLGEYLQQLADKNKSSAPARGITLLEDICKQQGYEDLNQRLTNASNLAKRAFAELQKVSEEICKRVELSSKQ